MGWSSKNVMFLLAFWQQEKNTSLDKCGGAHQYTELPPEMENIHWSFLVLLIGGRYHIIPQLAVHTTYILPIGWLYMIDKIPLASLGLVLLKGGYVYRLCRFMPRKTWYNLTEPFSSCYNAVISLAHSANGQPLNFGGLHISWEKITLG